MMKINPVALIIAISLVACQSRGVVEPAEVLRAEIIRIDRPSVLSGPVEAWVRLELKLPSRSGDQAFIKNLRRDQLMPSIGQICTLFYRRGLVQDIVGQHGERIDSAKIVEKFECHKTDKADRSN